MIFIASLIIYATCLLAASLALDIPYVRKHAFDYQGHFRHFCFIASLALPFFIPAGGFLSLIGVGLAGILLGAYGRMIGFTLFKSNQSTKP